MVHADLIDRLGGSRYLAHELGVSPQRVVNWRRRGISWEWRPTVAKLAQRRRFVLPPDFLKPNGRAA